MWLPRRSRISTQDAHTWQNLLFTATLKNHNVAVVHPNLEYLPKIAQNLGIEESDSKKLC